MQPSNVIDGVAPPESSTGQGRGRNHVGVARDTVATDGLQRLLEAETSLTGSEAKVLVALLELRTATLKQLSEASGIRESNVHSVVDSLATKGFCRRRAGRYSIWESPDPLEVLARLRAGEEARLEAARVNLERTFGQAEKILAGLGNAIDGLPISLDDDANSGALYLEAMGSVQGEILVLNRGPYPGHVGADPGVLDALARGVRARALYLAAEVEDPQGEIRRSAEIYAAAGVENRMLDDVPVSMALIGHQTAFLSLPAPDGSPAPPSNAATVRHEGMVRLLAAAFEHLWNQARPL